MEKMETHALQATETGFPHATDGLHPAKDRLDATADAHGIAPVAGRAAINGGALPLPGHMGGHVLVPQRLDELAAIIAFDRRPG